MQLAALNEDYLACADAARALKKAEAAAGDERRKFLLEAIRIAWDANRRKQSRLLEANPGDLYGFRAADGRSPELEGELALLEKARALLLAGEDGKLAPGLVAQALVPEVGGKLAAEPLASDVGGNKPELFADGKPDTAAFLAPGPAGRFVVDFGKEVTVSRVRFLANPERPITGFRLRAADASGAVSTLVHGSASGPEIFLVQALAFPATKARKLILEVERYEPVRSDRLGPALAEIEAYEK